MLRSGLLNSVILLSLVAVGSSQTFPPKSLPKEPLEKFDNPPAPLAPVTVTSPGLASQFGPYTSYQVNIDSNGNNIVGDAANEPSICVDLTNGNRMSIGWRQFDSVTSNFRQAGYAHTVNGGKTWTNIAPADGGDKQWFTIDTTNSIGHGFQYQSWSTDGNNFSGRQFS